MNTDQKKRAIQIWQKYFQEGQHFLNASQEYTHEQLDQRRMEVIPQVLAVLESYLSGKAPLYEFKTQIDSINKRNRLWGFQGINGQMFFNILTKTSQTAGQLNELEVLLKRTLPLPASPEHTVNIMGEFIQFTRGISKSIRDLRGAPKAGSIPFFLSYFWQMQSPQTYPVYYTSMVNILQEHNLWSPIEKSESVYLSFYQLNHELVSLLSEEAGQPLTLWDVEHAFWFMTMPAHKPVSDSPEAPSFEKNSSAEKKIIDIELPDSFIPPVVAILPRLAANDPELAKICTSMGTSIEVVFEKRIDVLFKMLGYETEALGHGHGRVPDGVAICKEYHYAIGYDAKVRQQSYSMGIDERAIKEYIHGLTDRLKKQGIRQIYFMIISSAFNSDHNEVIRSLKMDTDVREVLLVEAGALLALLEAKLREPMFGLGPEGIQRLLADSGILTESDVNEFRGI